ncbi:MULTISPECIES: alkaline phosphatase family protein [unclassified Variovorax]|uniref:alkaline phosphatase family protein n=1 Tax=unclassified Variovorax TaxID=663243 RepID=UPI00076D441A|nr:MULTISPECIES: alkaline phosphatase family protein [unclassified Variovorax]KWT92733.1 Arylsulfatase [Variovorax sp. WDL1]PNG58595.1 Arylsulfatase [Variovorax sp. B4]PNG61615.1 Arylsulfatase [Variovorax sp. B2]VTV12347.1 Arylsulfatase [Variovorax sp. WDL1]
MTRSVKNILFIMCDQLRADHLSCFGHPRLKTPNLDALAARGVIFDRAYVQSPVCGPSRMSYYTGRYVHSHGASWNFVPLKAGEMTIGDHLRPLGVRSVLVGKTHMRADLAGMSRLGIDPASTIGVRIAECGFDPYERDDGIHPYSGHDPDPSYNDYLRKQGFGGDNPWESWANSTVDDDGRIRSGWFLKYSNRAARVPDEHSETPYITRRAMDFIAEAGEQPWCLHLSYIKPHWPYIVPEPYASMYKAEDALPVVRSEAERQDPHPVYAAMMKHRVSETFSREGVRDAVMPGYMGLIKQIDDQLGKLFGFLEERGLMDTTMIVFTSDHGDYLGDHWMGEKDLFHEPIIRAPLIVYDPDPRADPTRGTRCDALVEAVDLAPTFLDACGGTPVPHIMDGRSLRPLLFGKRPPDWREHVVCEYDYAFQDSRIALGTPSREAWLRMISDGRWKYVLAEGYRPMLFDLASDPNEFVDLGAAPEHEGVRQRLHEALFRWARQPRQRVTIPDGAIETMEIQPRISEGGILIGYWDEEDLSEARKRFKPRFASTNPLVKPTLDRLTGQEGVST